MLHSKTRGEDSCASDGLRCQGESPGAQRRVTLTLKRSILAVEFCKGHNIQRLLMTSYDLWLFALLSHPLPIYSSSFFLCLPWYPSSFSPCVDESNREQPRSVSIDHKLLVWSHHPPVDAAITNASFVRQPVMGIYAMIINDKETAISDCEVQSFWHPRRFMDSFLCRAWSQVDNKSVENLVIMGDQMEPLPEVMSSSSFGVFGDQVGRLDRYKCWSHWSHWTPSTNCRSWAVSEPRCRLWTCRQRRYFQLQPLGVQKLVSGCKFLCLPAVWDWDWSGMSQLKVIGICAVFVSGTCYHKAYRIEGTHTTLESLEFAEVRSKPKWSISSTAWAFIVTRAAGCDWLCFRFSPNR